MILECPSCSTRYMVHIGLFAQGGRKVRCARCKHEWHVALPSTVDVFAPPPDIVVPPPGPEVHSPFPIPPTCDASSSAPLPDIPDFMSKSANLPAVIKRERIPKRLLFFAGGGIAAAFLLVGLSVAWNSLNKPRPPEWEGLAFDDVKSELKYDSGTMRLFVDGQIQNMTEERINIPGIRAKALGPDKRIIQNWVVEAPAATLEAGAKISFHTEVASPMEHTIQEVNLEFVPQREKADAN
jgi:predicted Zn finger-like uncharacterized protein